MVYVWFIHMTAFIYLGLLDENLSRMRNLELGLQITVFVKASGEDSPWHIVAETEVEVEKSRIFSRKLFSRRQILPIS